MCDFACLSLEMSTQLFSPQLCLQLIIVLLILVLFVLFLVAVISLSLFFIIIIIIIRVFRIRASWWSFAEFEWQQVSSSL